MSGELNMATRLHKTPGDALFFGAAAPGLRAVPEPGPMAPRIMSTAARSTVLHYVGCDEDRGGIVSVVRALDGAGRFDCVLGVNAGCRQRRQPPLPVLELPRLAGEKLGWQTFWRSRTVAREVQAWLRAEPGRVFHGHSRTGLAVALRLVAQGERRVVASVHCYGRQRWFYRWAARRLGPRLFWLTPAMKHYYRVADDGTWTQCVPSCAPVRPGAGRRPATDGVVRLGGIGALVEWKGWHFVLEALAALPAPVRSRLHFSHIGSADGSAASQRYAATLGPRTAALGLEHGVTWRGEEPSSEALLRETDCLVIPSVNEPFSVAMLEALAAGVPVLAADSGGPRDVLTPPEDGWLFRSGDARDLARQLAALLESGAWARARISPEKLRRFSATEVAATWESIYARCAGAD
jgi:glycosyltransferase involved in cell wall biosynthesis